MSHIATLLAGLLVICGQSLAAEGTVTKLHRIDAQTAQGLQALFEFTGEPLPLVSGHRGGPQKGFPENCIPTFEHTLQHTFAMLEVDPRYTKDGGIVIFHDPTLDRTSNGKGKVTDFTLAELKQLRLKDTEGNVTEFPIPTLDEALEWTRGKAILVLDQKDVPVAVRVKKIEEHKAEGHAVMIVNTFKDAKECHTLNPNIMMEVMIPNRAKFAEFEQLGIAWRNVVAFVGHVPPEDLQLYEMIHAKGAHCMISTSRNLDRKFIRKEVTTMRELETGYRDFLKRGADLIETDIPSHLGPMLYGATPVPASKGMFFRSP